MRWLGLAAGLLLAAPAHADMYQDGSNAELPEARTNLGSWPTVDAVKDLGCKGDGTTDNTACITAAAAKTGNPNIYFGPGTYVFGCGPYNFAGAATVIGAGRSATVLKVQPGCTLPFITGGAGDGLFNMRNGNGGGWRDLSIDLIGVLDNDVGGAVFSVVFNYTCQNAFLIENIAMTNIGDSSIGVFAQAAGCPSENWTIRNSRFHLTVQEPLHGNSGNVLMGGGAVGFYNIHITGNRFENGGLQVTGTDIFVTNNEFSGWASGSAIYIPPRLGWRTTVTGNIMRDSATTFDINNTPAEGIESHGEYLIFANNICQNLGGQCVKQFGSYGLFEGNISQNVGRGVPQNENWGAYHTADHVGPAFPFTPIPPTNNVFQNNVSLGGPMERYGFFERTLVVPHVNTIVRNNKFSGYTEAAYKITNATTKVEPGPGESVISTVTTNQTAWVSNTIYKPSGASLDTINEITSNPTLGARP